MGVAGDGSGNKLEAFDMTSVVKTMDKSRDRSAKNAWGSTTGYADDLIDQGMEAQRAQQLENWKNQQEGMYINVLEWIVCAFVNKTVAHNFFPPSIQYCIKSLYSFGGQEESAVYDR